MVYGCDICQEVCPWNRGVEKRRAGERARGEPVVSVADWLQADATTLAERYDRLYVPRNDARYLRRNALVALGNVGRPEDAALAEPYAAAEGDPMLAEHARWAQRRIAERTRT
jgi:epoxyqueuosine reductase